ncbi:hypothetical protein [Paenibacillus eucommiae]|uniref:Acetyl-CoA acetyltransferase n=1 Tax=Paenibacillus eucommiae TaxID=1355755 RepID=A0ABS4JAH7_9BACL|nr:hypothetical protein [Paenibacillus eucommiae]MBP1996828.1 hypothetical protein [Paenibacillus eucommiae]
MYPHEQSNVIFQADPSHIDILRYIKDSNHSICSQYLGHPVRVETIDGHVFEGVIVYMDGRNLHLQVQEQNRAFYNPVAATILPLVLYELLVITLLSGR